MRFSAPGQAGRARRALVDGRRAGWATWLRGWRAVGLGLGLGIVGAGCGSEEREVVVYAAQDRVYSEPILREFEDRYGFRVRALYDSEATKTVGLANRLIAEGGRPQADVWWNNEEMRTRQLVARGVLEPGGSAFGARRRVLVVRTNSELRETGPVRLAELTRAEWKGRVALAYPVFGSTTTHFLALRQRWGEEAWRAWCRALAANRPLIVDGNSVVVRLVAQGQADVGLTDSDDVSFGRREGLAVVAVALAEGDGLSLPNTVARVKGSRNEDGARQLMEFLGSGRVLERLATEGAIDVPEAGPAADAGLGEAQWNGLLTDLDASLDWLRGTFVR